MLLTETGKLLLPSLLLRPISLFENRYRERDRWRHSDTATELPLCIFKGYHAQGFSVYKKLHASR